LLDCLAAEAWVLNSDSAAAYSNEADGVPRLDGVIVGGESGPGARPCHPDWVRSLRDQCDGVDHFLGNGDLTGVPFHFKQWGRWMPLPAEARGNRNWMLLSRDGDLDIPDDRAPDEATGEVAVIRGSKSSAGRLLDGRLHDDLPWTVYRPQRRPPRRRKEQEPVIL
jgi:hypothetical protein